MFEPTAGGTRLVLVRHGETEGNVSQVWHGSLDAPLTRRGQQQVAAVAARMAAWQDELPVHAFYVSPLPRAQSTAAAIAAAIGVTPQVEPGLREFDLGDWEGRSFRELREQENLWGRWEQDPGFAPPNGESPRSFGRRAAATLTRLADRHPGQTVLVVTHGGFISNVLAAWLGKNDGDWRAYDPHNCAVSVLRRDGDGWHGELVNDVAHLPAAARAADMPDY
jgi:2,3-bisphosphoglycerate-dependent phosphoglycerate mutase